MSYKTHAPSQVHPCLSWILNFGSLTLLRRHCLIGGVSQKLFFWDSRRSQVSPCFFSTRLLDTVAGWRSIPHRSRRAYLATLSLGTVEDVVVGEVDELEEDVEWSISCLEGVMDVEEASLRKNSSINQEPSKQLVLLVMDGVSLLVEEVHDKFSQIFFEAILVRISPISAQTVGVQWLLALVGGGNLSDSPSGFSWSSPRTWMVPCQGWSSQNFSLLQKIWIVHLRFLWEVSAIWASSSPSRWALCCGILMRPPRPIAQGPPPWEFLSNYLSQRTRRIRGVLRVILCSRIGGISIGQKQEWSDTHSNEPNKFLWLNYFVEGPFLWYFSQIVANSSWNPSIVRWSIATVSQRFLPLFSVPLFSSLIKFWTVGFRRFHQIKPLIGRVQQ